MTRGEPELVDLVREFIAAHDLMSLVVARGRAGSLRWPDVQRLVGENDSSRLYRLKERSHQLSRSRDAGDDLSRTALFDLAVGSLFHEAMKLRENFYQLEVYAPRVAQAETTATPGTEALFGEFARILSASRERMIEAVDECAALLTQMQQQFRELLAEHRDDGLVARFLFENRDAAEKVLGESIAAFFVWSLDGEAADGFAGVARSYLESGFFDEAVTALDAALALRPEDPVLRSDRCYALGMRCYRRGDYGGALDELEVWLAQGVPAGDPRFASLARTALAGLPALITPADDKTFVTRAEALVEKLSTP